MKYGKFLQKEGRIGLIAPSFGCNIEPYKTGLEEAIRRFRDWGYHVCEGPNIYEGKGMGISNTPEACAEEFMDYYCSEDNDVLISCGGGELMCEILPHIDFEQIKSAPPKWFMGYSDNANLTFLLATIADTASIYGPCAPTFGMETLHPALEDAFAVLKGEVRTVSNYDGWELESLKTEENPICPFNITEPFECRCLPDPPVTFSGRLLGGCLDILSNLRGTRYDHVREFNRRYKKDGVIWFLESCDLTVLDIRRALWSLREAGWFDEAKGFLVGRPYHYGEELMGLDQYRAVTEILGDLDLPVIMDLDIGHLPPMMPLVTGSKATVYAEADGIRIDMEYV